MAMALASNVQPARVQPPPAPVQPTKMQQQLKGERRMFSTNDDSAMMKQIQATHSPDGREVEVKPILTVIEDILNRARPSIAAVVNGTHDHIDTMDDKIALSAFDGVLEGLAHIIHRTACELSCKCSGGGDAHATTMAIFHSLSNYSWDAKVVISLAAFAVCYGEFWLVAHLCATNPLAKSVAILKQLPDIIEHSHSLKSRFDAITNLLKAMIDVTKCIVEFKELPPQYISPDTPPMSLAMAHIPIAAYWTIRSMVACASQITSLLGMSYEYITSTTEAWELSSLAHKVSNIHGHLTEQIGICYQYVDEKKHAEYYQMLLHLFEIPHLDNMKILKALIYSKDDILPLYDVSSKMRVSVEILKRKTVLLLISDLDVSNEEILTLGDIYHESRTARKDQIHYDVVWLPIVERSITWNEGYQRKFEQLQSMMPWHTLHHPSLLEPAVTRYIKEVWHFQRKMMLVVLDPQGKVVCPNAHHMMWIWGNFAYPFTTAKEEALWKEETWKLELLVDGIDEQTLHWIQPGIYICLYGGEDIKWIRDFTSRVKAVAKALGITIEMVYVGKSKTKERVRKNIEIIDSEHLSYSWHDLTSIWFFWSRLESMLYSKMEHGKSIENDQIMQEVMTVLSFDGSDLGWAIFSKGSAEMAKAKGDLIVTCLTEFGVWEENAKEKGFVPALIEHLERLHTPQHCNRLILPGINGDIQERVICAECGRPMEKYLMYRCCTD
ncbi:protein SIEVE ELEMENT OCCLUSION B-like isoform X1 [Cornus florida]|uniref:protein SIEVE ELEMENT OCCLUSION B-like isoform X1 n=1 Tax=Cornus florida TaxID=4283 RepID=UPI002899D1F7|nr:protein SIEVE ELEMENT OCCLUSION B-like isoform X1 [Cornus florida]